MRASTKLRAVNTQKVVRPVLPTGVARHILVVGLPLLAGTTQAAQLVIDGPAGSDAFGRTVTTLPNGNIVVTDPGFDEPAPIVDVGAVYLYRPDGSLISTLRGNSAGDAIGSGGVVVLTNGNYVVISPSWRNGSVANAGAVTFGSQRNGITGVVSPTNSLVGSSAGDFLNAGVTALTNGNYVVRSPNWDNGATADVGAATFGSGTTGITGVVSPANALVGSTASDRVGSSGLTRLTNGNYVVSSRFWDNGAAPDAGAVTFGSGTSGITGVVSPANSLVGGQALCFVGSGPDGFSGSGVIALTNGNYVVNSPFWDGVAFGDLGAVTFASGTSGITGVVSAANSLVGSSSLDRVGGDGVVALANGNYLVSSSEWNHGATANVGAVTFGSGTTGITGPVSPANSLVGSQAHDSVGGSGVTALTSGNYVVSSPSWNNGATLGVGAVTFGSGTTGITGVVSPTNSLIGSTRDDAVGFPVALTNGNYVVLSPFWNNGALLEAGAVTLGSGTSGVTGVVSPANSLVGSTSGDRVGSRATPLNNGNYVLHSPRWDNGTIVDAGAVTFGSGTSSITGVVSPVNSLVGSTASDSVGLRGVIALTNGNFVVSSPNWDHGPMIDAGAVTFGSGTSGIAGVLSAANSLIGSSVGDGVGNPGVTALPNGNYVVSSRFWDNGGIADVGAITLGLFNGSVVGTITSAHSVLGSAPALGGTEAFSYDATRNQLAVGQPASNRVVLHRTGIATATSITAATPDPSIQGQPVTFTATTTGSPNPPADGQVTFTASTGETCVDDTPAATSTTTAEWSCTIAFTAPGAATVIAEYTGSIIHAYSGSAPEAHTTIAEPTLFGNGFEGP